MNQRRDLRVLRWNKEREFQTTLAIAKSFGSTLYSASIQGVIPMDLGNPTFERLIAGQDYRMPTNDLLTKPRLPYYIQKPLVL
jgi:hypothetical protein